MRSLTAVAAAAVVAAAALIVDGAIVVVGGPVPDDRWGTRGLVVELVFVVAACALVAAAAGLTPLLDLHRGGRIAVLASQIGLAAMAVESVAGAIHGGNILGGVFLGGVALTLLGSLALGVDGLVSGRRRWAALLPAAGLVVGIAAGDQGGLVVWGAVWLLLAAAIGRAATAEQRPAVGGPAPS